MRSREPIRLRYRLDRGPARTVGPLRDLGASACLMTLLRPDAPTTVPLGSSTSAATDLARLAARPPVTIPGGRRLRGIETAAGEVLMANSFDGVGRLLRVDFAGGRSCRLEYGAGGRIESVRYEDGRAVAFRYLDDGLGQIEYPGRRLFEFTRDELGRIVTCSLPDGRTQTFEHDTCGRTRAIRAGDTALHYRYGEDRGLERIEMATRSASFTLDLGTSVLDRPHGEGVTSLGELAASEDGGFLSFLQWNGRLTVQPHEARWHVPNQLSIWSAGGEETLELPTGSTPSIFAPNGDRTVFHPLSDDTVAGLRSDGITVYETDGEGRLTRIRSDDGTYVVVGYNRASRLHCIRTGAGEHRYGHDGDARIVRIGSPGSFAARLRYGDEPAPTSVTVRGFRSDVLSASTRVADALWEARVSLPRLARAVRASTDSAGMVGTS